MGDKDDTQEAHKGDSGESFGFTAPLFDVEKYGDMLGEPEIPEAQQREFLTVLWQIMVAFSDLGFGLHPVQQVMDKSQSKIERSGVNSAFLRAGKKEIGVDKFASGKQLPDAVRKE